MVVLEVDWLWTVSFIDPSCDGSARVKVAGSLENVLELGLKLRQAGLKVRRIVDPAAFEIPLKAVDCYERLKPLYDNESSDCGAVVIPFRQARGRYRSRQ